MGIYRGDYQSDLGRATYNALLYVALVDTDFNIPLTTSYSQDAAIVPLIYTVELKQSNLGCEVEGLTKRYARLWVSANQYLKVDLPWFGGSSSFNSFFQQARANDEIIKTDLIGEQITPYYTRKLSN